MNILAELANSALTVGLVITLIVVIGVIASFYDKPPRR